MKFLIAGFMALGILGILGIYILITPQIFDTWIVLPNNPNNPLNGNVPAIPKTCSGTDKLSALQSNGIFVCSTDQTGGGGTGVNSIIAGSGISLVPTNGLGDVTITATGGSSSSNTFESRTIGGHTVLPNSASWSDVTTLGLTIGAQKNCMIHADSDVWHGGADTPSSYNFQILVDGAQKSQTAATILNMTGTSASTSNVGINVALAATNTMASGSHTLNLQEQLTMGSSGNSLGLGTWVSTTSYPLATQYMPCVQYGGYIYCVDGITGSAVNNVYYSPITTGVGSWTATNSYPIAIRAFTCVTPSNSIYCASGNSGSTFTANVYHASILTDNTVGTWAKTANSYPINIAYNDCVYSNGYMYCIGGYKGGGQSGDVANVYYSKILTSGEINAWQSTNSYPVQIESERCVVYNGYIYCAGGYNSQTGHQQAGVYYAHILSGNDLGTWTATTSLPTAMDELACAGSNDYMYCGGGTPDTAMYYAPLTTTGVGTWQATTAYPAANHNFPCVFNNNGKIYCIAGSEGSDVYYSPILTSTKWAQNYGIDVYCS